MKSKMSAKKRNPGVMSANRLAVSQLKKSGAGEWFEKKHKPMKSKMNAKQVIRLAKKNFPYNWRIINFGAIRNWAQLDSKCPIQAAGSKKSFLSYFKVAKSLGLSDKIISLIVDAADNSCGDNKTCQQIRHRMLKELVGDNT